MRAAREVVNGVFHDWIRGGKLYIAELEQLMTVAIMIDRMAVYHHAAQVAHDIETGKVTDHKTVYEALLQCAKDVAKP